MECIHTRAKERHAEPPTRDKDGRVRQGIQHALPGREEGCFVTNLAASEAFRLVLIGFYQSRPEARTGIKALGIHENGNASCAAQGDSLTSDARGGKSL